MNNMSIKEEKNKGKNTDLTSYNTTLSSMLTHKRYFIDEPNMRGCYDYTLTLDLRDDFHEEVLMSTDNYLTSITFEAKFDVKDEE